MGYNRNEGSDANVSRANTLGDLYYLAGPTYGGSPATDNMIRILKPSYATLVACYLDMTLTTSASETAPNFRISVGKTTSNTDFTPVTPTSAEIDACMLKLTGAVTPFSNTAGQPIRVAKLDLMRVMPSPSSADYRNDTFVIGIHFTKAPTTGGTYALSKFDLSMSAQVLP